jgi:putative MFS transporter
MSNIAPYTIEQYGVRLGGRSSGLAHAAAGFGKIAGPLVLALIAGTGNLLRPEATEAAVFPAFLLLAFCMLLVTFAFLFLSVEMHGREIGFEPAGAPARRPEMAPRPSGTAD